MPDAITLAGVLLTAGTVLGLAPVANPPLLTIWTGTREHHLATVFAHQRAWALLNAGFAIATLATAAGLVVLGAGDLPTPRGLAMLAVAMTYALSGAAWIGVLAIRTRTTPVIARLVADGQDAEPQEALLGAALGGLFALFIVVAGIAVTALGILVIIGGVAPAWTGIAIAAGGALVLAVQLRTGDCIPALLYLPTLLLGIALLAGWR